MVIFALLSCGSGEVFPEDGAIPKTVAWKILDRQWKIIEPILFTESGKEHVGRSVRFPCTFVIVGDRLEVITAQGTKAVVTRIPAVDMKLLKKLKQSASVITVEGTLTAIDPKGKGITVKGGGIRAGGDQAGERQSR